MRYPVVNLGQVPQYVTLDDFRGFVTQANSSVKAVADIAKAHGLSDDETKAVDAEVSKVAGYTLPMAKLPEPPPCPVAAAGPPVWALAAGALLAGGILGRIIF